MTFTPLGAATLTPTSAMRPSFTSTAPFSIAGPETGCTVAPRSRNESLGSRGERQRAERQQKNFHCGLLSAGPFFCWAFCFSSSSFLRFSRAARSLISLSRSK